jgi:hypothetical protein
MLFMAAFVLVAGGWVLRNYLAVGVPRIANGFGAVFYTGSELRFDGDEPAFSGMQWPTHRVTRPYDHVQTQGDRRLMRAATENIRAHPLDWALLGVCKVGRLLIGGPRWHFGPGADHLRGAIGANGRSRAIIRFVWWTIAGTVVTVFGLAGLLLLRRERPLFAVGGLTLVAYYALLHAVSFANPRYAVVFYPVLVLGCVGYFQRRRRVLLTGSLVAVCAAVCVWIATYHYYRPASQVADDSTRYFQVDREWEATAAGHGAFVVECGGFMPPFNTCLFLRISARGSEERATGIVRVCVRRTGSEEFDEDQPIWMPVRLDGETHTYRTCVELVEGWRRKRWSAVRVDAPGGKVETIEVGSVVAAH